jgi:hypothetical protein
MVTLSRKEETSLMSQFLQKARAGDQHAMSRIRAVLINGRHYGSCLMLYVLGLTPLQISPSLLVDDEQTLQMFETLMNSLNDADNNKQRYRAAISVASVGASDKPGEFMFVLPSDRGNKAA